MLKARTDLPIYKRWQEILVDKSHYAERTEDGCSSQIRDSWMGHLKANASWRQSKSYNLVCQSHLKGDMTGERDCSRR